MILKDLDFINYEKDNTDLKEKGLSSKQKKIEQLKAAQILGNGELKECQQLIDNFIDSLKNMSIITFDVDLLKFELNSMIVRNAEVLLSKDQKIIDAIGVEKYREARSAMFQQIIQKYNIHSETDK